MSEFSASYHLKAHSQQTAADLLKRSGSPGFVYPEQNGWVTFVVRGPAFDIDESVIDENPGILVHYIYAEDHGWELRIFKKNDLAFEYKCDWTDELQVEKNLLDLELLRELIMEQGNSAEGIEAIFDLGEDAFDSKEPPAYTIARKLGLTYFEWVSADYMDHVEREESILVVD